MTYAGAKPRRTNLCRETREETQRGRRTKFMPSTGSLRLTAVTRREVQLWLVRFSNRERIEDLTALLFCTLLLTVPEVFAQGVQLPDCTSLEAAQTETERSYDELIRKTNADFEEIKRNAFLAGLG